VIALSPAKLMISTAANFAHGGEWFRLARTDDGILCLESISDATLHRSGPPAPWAFAADVPPHVARQLDGYDDDPDQVAKVLGRAIHALGYAE
jgi:hypothetical protein